MIKQGKNKTNSCGEKADASVRNKIRKIYNVKIKTKKKKGISKNVKIIKESVKRKAP